MFLNKGKILKIKTGYNPNSSSIGTDLTPLLIGGSIVSFLIPIITVIVSRILKKKAIMPQEISNKNFIPEQPPGQDNSH